MKALLTPRKLSNADGLSAFDLLLVVAIVSMIAGFLVFSLVRGTALPTALLAVEIVGYLQKAHSGPMRRNARELNQMSQVLFNRRFIASPLMGRAMATSMFR